MSRISTNTALDGYDYENQAWYQTGVYVRCGHPDSMDCNCYGKINEGKLVVMVVTPALWPAVCMACKEKATIGIWSSILKVEVTLCKPCVYALQIKVGA